MKAGSILAPIGAVKPKVTVGVLTYNHAKYIREALDSILMQEVDFPLEVVVHDDASEDGTREIVASYASAHPDIFRTIFQQQNQLKQGRFAVDVLWPNLNGEYIAFLDGDDAWTNSRKLATQASFLDSHPECSICQTRTVYYNELAGEIIRSFPPPHRSSERHALSDLAAGNFVQTCAVMMRSSALPKLPPGLEALPFTDYAIFALVARSGWIGLIDAEMAKYRIHDANFWISQSEEERWAKTKRVIEFIIENLPPSDRPPWIAAITPRDLSSSTGYGIRRGARGLLCWVRNRALVFRAWIENKFG